MPSEWFKGDVIQERLEVQDVKGGGMGIVLKLRDRETGRKFAAKTFRDDILSSFPSVRQRFIDECTAMVRMGRHQNIVLAESVEVLKGRPYLFMEWMDGDTLSGLVHKLSAEGNTRRVVSFGLQFCRGMMHANSSGIAVHRDIKPDNCFIVGQTRLRIADFGLAKILDGVPFPEIGGVARDPRRLAPCATRTGALLGTPPYMAPELFDDPRHADVRADVYYEMIAGRLPFYGQPGEWEVLQKEIAPPPLPRTSPDLRGLIKKCLSKKPEERFNDFAELTDELTLLFEEVSLTGAHPAPKRDPRKALRLFEQGKFEEACQHLDPSQSDIDRAAQLFAQGKTEKAWNAYLRSRSGTFKIPIVDMQEAYAKAKSLHNLGRYQEAIRWFDKALEILPKAETWSGKGSSLRALGQLGEALECYDKAIAINPGFADAWNNKGTTLQALKKHEDALNCFDRALSIAPESGRTQYNRGMALVHLGRVKDALDCFNRSSQLGYADAKEKAARCAAAIAYSESRETGHGSNTPNRSSPEKPSSSHSAARKEAPSRVHHPRDSGVFKARLGSKDVTMIQGTVRVAGGEIKILLEFEILVQLVRLGLKPRKALSKLSSTVSEATGKAMVAISPSLFTDLVEEAMHAHGANKFKGLVDLRTPVFVLACKFITHAREAKLAGYDRTSGAFCITRKVFEKILPAVPTEEYRRVLLQLWIGRALLQALGRTDQDLDKEDNDFVVKMLGPRKASELAELFNRIVKAL